VQKEHVNVANHVGYADITRILHQTVIDVLHELGLRESDLGDGKTGVFEEEALVNFRSEAFLGDPLLMEVHIGEISAEGFNIYHRITRRGALIVVAENGLVGYDFAGHIRAPVPETFGTALTRYRQGQGGLQ
jgi:acyl-CoA thioesterase FadM